MRNETDAKSNSAAGVAPTVPWAVTSVHVLPGYRLAVGFNDGTMGEVDASQLILAEDAGVFVALRDPDSFARAHVAGGAVVWPNGLDLAPDAMYDAIRATGVFVPE